MFKNLYTLIFFFSLIFRSLYLIISYYLEVDFTSCCDFHRYDNLSTNILNGNFDMSGENFIVAPVFPVMMSMAKYISIENYLIITQLFQILISSISVYYLMKIADILFQNKKITIITGLIYSLYPITFWYVIYLGQETLFQSFLIISFFYFIKFFLNFDNKNWIIFSVFFTITILTKSHILLFVPFIFLSLLIKLKNFLISLKFFFKFLLILFIFNLPHALNNKFINGHYVLSSSGVGYHFLVSHNDDFYTWTINPPKKYSPEYKRLSGMRYAITNKIDLENANLNQQDKDKIRILEAINWIKNNPKKTIHLKYVHFVNFLQPGFSYLHHSKNKWWISLLISLPLFLFAYCGLFVLVKKDFKKHFFIFYLFITMLIFSLIFYTQNRFRVITIEPFYILYASYFLFNLIEKIKNFKNKKFIY